tara:strand:- start:446 stop:568 length:123 start_codon:yes stop_codon:yes gene_type:complete
MKLRHNEKKNKENDFVLESEIDCMRGGIFAKAKDDRGKRI